MERLATSGGYFARAWIAPTPPDFSRAGFWALCGKLSSFPGTKASAENFGGKPDFKADLSFGFPAAIILIGESAKAAGHPLYRWTRSPGLALGC